ncbi:MAG: alpha/beta hydrolase [Gammaproteobacteria bacterium]|nr:alpha/beta hydrolase [Gammaproteobacteria bacterium]
MKTNYFSHDDIEIFYETFGDNNDPAVLLIMGACSPGCYWPDEFCQRIVDQGYFVIRYDHRDTGCSSAIDFAKNPYNLEILAQDAIELLGCLEVKKVHLIGTSMGGYVAQLMTLERPELVFSLSLLTSTFDLSHLGELFVNGRLSNSKLSPPCDAIVDSLVNHTEIDLVDSWHILHSDAAKFPLDFYQALAAVSYEHNKPGRDPANHLRAINKTDFNIAPKLKNIKVPVLVVHGTNDPILPLDHGVALAGAFDDARFVVVDKMGHMLAPEFWRQILAAFFI